METEQAHIIPFRVYGRVLVFLLCMTFLTVTAALVNLSALTVVIALSIAIIKSGVVLSYFMHLKFESLLFRVLVAGVFVIYLMVIVVVFFDYLFR